MSNNQTTLTVADVAAMPDDSWINSAVEAHVVKIDAKAYKPPKTGTWYSAHLSDGGGDTIATLSYFNGVPKFQAGDSIRLGGKGLKKSSYNGKAQIGLGKESTVEVRPGVQRVQNAMHESKAEHANGEMVPGPTVGMAINNALTLLTLGGAQDVNTPGFWQAVHETASDIIRVARLLEHGKLADPVRVRATQPPARASRPSTVEEELGAEEEVPF